MLARDGARHHAEKHEAVARLSRLAEVEVDLELPDGVLVVKGVDAPAQLLHRVHQLPKPRQVVEQTCRVVAGFVQVLGTRSHASRESAPACVSARLCRAWCHSMICVRGSALHLKAAEGVLGAHRREVGRVLAGGEMKAV